MHNRFELRPDLQDILDLAAKQMRQNNPVMRKLLMAYAADETASEGRAALNGDDT